MRYEPVFKQVHEVNASSYESLQLRSLSDGFLSLRNDILRFGDILGGSFSTSFLVAFLVNGQKFFGTEIHAVSPAALPGLRLLP